MKRTLRSVTPTRPALAAIILTLATLVCGGVAGAAEPWADERMPVREGLLLWLDAGRQPAPVKHGAPAAIWSDGSGNGRHALQPARDARPVFVRAEDAATDATTGTPAAVRFDGTDDCLLITGAQQPVDSVTLVLVAAPRSNTGFFRGLFAAAALGVNDYTSGLNVDLGPGMTARLDTFNVEGAGTVGAANLLTPAGPIEFGTVHTFAVTSVARAGGITLRVDGKPAGKRDRAAGSIVRLDQLVIGGRIYSNEATPPFVQGFLDGYIAEVMLFDRALPDGELAKVEKYLADKYATFKLPPAEDAPAAAGTRKLVPVKDPPAVQVFAPGFVPRCLPLELNNVNNVRYRSDGKLVALGYDGNVHLLTDTDGDGLEDRSKLFWDNKGRIQSPIGMALTPPGYARGDGLFVAGKGKVSLIVDTDKDDVADREIIVATGWTPLAHSVDAMGVAFAPDGSLYFGLGTANFTNAYLVEADGKARYDLASERGTILRVSPDFKRREIVATGVRFSVALGINPQGDLFATDQEGATWLPNGNPFDELLHIQTGRHYGFPPRHPKHLPDVIDEPSVVDYRPQHQSACGLAFNVPVNSGAAFGPAAWAGDAIVTGYSRGKLYRTQLVKTPSGYVAQTHLIASMTTMPADACVSPAGDLVVAGHGGAPDWGSGPAGQGALYKISYADKEKPQPLFAYAAGPRELRVAFDRPLDPAALKGLAERASVEYGDAVAAGDRFETLRPGYEVVQRQLVAPRFGLDVHGVAMTPDRRTLVIQTAPMSRASTYAITLPGQKPNDDARLRATPGAERSGAPDASPAARRRTLQAGSGVDAVKDATDATAPINRVDAIDLACDTGGVEASWTPGDGAGTPAWTGWLPHLDLAVSAALTRGSAEHDALWAAMKKPGVLRLRAQLDLADMLRPVVQPGSRIDYTWPPETVTVTFDAKGKIDLKAPKGVSIEQPTPAKVNIAVTEAAIAPGKPDRAWVPVNLTLALASGRALPLDVSWHTKEDPRPRALPLRRILVPWSQPAGSASPILNPDPSAEPTLRPELTGGSWSRGRAVYFSEQAMCAKCHVLREDGASKIGPDLSNLHHRDYASVLQDVLSPSAAINPDHVAYAITLADGNVLTGVPRSEGDDNNVLVVGEPGGKETRVARADVKSMEPLSNSIMPHGIDQVIGKAGVRDLMTFLMTPPLEPAPLEIDGAPPPRTRAEVEAVLKASAPSGERKVKPAPKGQATRRAVGAVTPKPLRIVLAAGPKDHGPGEHDYPAWQRRWRQLLARAEAVEVEASFGWPEPEHFETADVIVFYSNNPGWGADKAEQLDAYLQRGGGLVYLHFAVDGHAAPEVLGARIGLAWRGGASKFRHGPLDLRFIDPAHPITRGFDRVKFVDESYWQLIGDASKINLLATGAEEDKPQPLLWTHEPAGKDKGRVFVSIPGHYAWTFDDPLFRILLLRGIAWAGREDNVDRLSDLATVGARMDPKTTPAKHD